MSVDSMSKVGKPGKTSLRPVTKDRPCPVCGKTHKCSRGDDGLIVCGRACSEAPGFVHLGPCKGDDQFHLYRRDGDPMLSESNDHNLHRAAPKVVLADWLERAATYRRALTPELRRELAEDLGAPDAALEALCVGWHGPESCWTFPEVDGAGNVIGISRRFRGGEKKAMAGGQRGLYAPDGWRERPGPLFLPEGASNTIALTAMGLSAVGRPNNAGGVECLAALLSELAAERQVIVVGDFDPKQDGRWPGKEGAVKLAVELSARLNRRVTWVLPSGAKDVREWFKGRKPDLTCADALHDLGEQLSADLVARAKPGAAAGGAADPALAVPPKAKPAPAARTLPPYRPFPVGALPGPLDLFVGEAATAIGCDAAFVALPALSAAAAAIGNSRTVRLKRGWDEPCIIWSALIGDSGTLKSPAYAAVVAHLFRLQRRLLDEYKQALAEYDDKLAKWKEEKRDKGDDAGERPNAPVFRRVIVSDITIEKLSEVLEDNPRGVLVARDELSGWLGSFTRYKGKQGGTDLPNWLEMHRAGPIQYDRKTGDRRTVFVPRAAASVTGGIQPGTLTRALTPEFLDAGLAARLLLAMPPRRRKKWTEAEIDPETEAAFAFVCDKLRALEMRQDGRDLLPVSVGLSEEAKRMWVGYYDEFAGEQASAEGELAAAMSKLEGYAARLALLHHAVRCVVQGMDCTSPISADSMAAGIALSQWFVAEARRVYATLNESDQERNTRRLVEFIQARGGSMAPRELQRANDAKYPTVEHAEGALDALAEAGLGCWFDPPENPSGGRPRSRRLTLHPTPDKTDETPTVNGEPVDDGADENP